MQWWVVWYLRVTDSQPFGIEFVIDGMSSNEEYAHEQALVLSSDPDIAVASVIGFDVPDK